MPTPRKTITARPRAPRAPVAATAAAPVAPEERLPMLRNSERTTWRRCSMKWWWSYRDGLQQRGHSTPNALWFGTGIHLALAGWYTGPGDKRGPHPAETFEAWAANETRRIRVENLKNENWDEEQWVSARDLGISMLSTYVDKYGIDETWDIISQEQTFQVVIPKPKPQSGNLVLYVGTFDLVYRDLLNDNSIFLGEHKTAKALVTGHLPLDDQTGAYWTVAYDTLLAQKRIKKTDRIDGITYNMLRKAMPDERPTNDRGSYLNKDGSVSKVQPSPFFLREPVYRMRKERAMQIRRIQDEATVMAAQVRGELPVWKNPTRDCQFDCHLREMCELHEQGSDWQEYRDAVFVVEDPYSAHRMIKSAAE